MDNDTIITISEFVNRLEGVSAAVWDILLWQATIVGWSSLGVGCILTIMLMTWARYVAGIKDKDDRTLVAFLSALASILPLALVLFVFDTAITALMNPRFWAIQELAKMVR